MAGTNKNGDTRGMSEESRQNLVQFTEKTARICGANGGKKKKENEPIRKAHEELKKEIIRESYSQTYQRLLEGKLSNQELIAVFKSAIDMSGDKTQTQEIKGDVSIMPTTFNILPVRGSDEL